MDGYVRKRQSMLECARVWPRMAQHYVTNDTLHHDFNVLYVRDEIKRFGDKIILTHSRRNLMRDVKTSRRLKEDQKKIKSYDDLIGL